MRKFSHLFIIFISLAVALTLSACGGNIKSKSDTKTPTPSGVDDPDDPLVIIDDPDEEDPEDKDPDNTKAPSFWPSMISDVTVQCGKSFNMAIQTKGGTGEISWPVIEGLPSWAKAEPSGASKSSLYISGTMPFAGCDVVTYPISLKACSSDGKSCSENSFDIKTKIHGIAISTPLNNRTSIIDIEDALPELSADHGSGSYTFRTVIPKTLTGEGQDKIIEGKEVKFTPKKMGTHTITVTAMDTVFEGRQESIASKMEVAPNLIGTSSKTFNVTVQEGGFIITVFFLNKDGNANEIVTSGQPTPTDETAHSIPYEGGMGIMIQGKGENYKLSLKSPKLSDINLDQVEIAPSVLKKIDFFTAAIREKVEALTEPISIEVKAENESGESQSFTVNNITVTGDPCKSFSVGTSEENAVLSFERGRMWTGREFTGSNWNLIRVPLSAKDGKGPFIWKIDSALKKELSDEEYNATITATIADGAQVTGMTINGSEPVEAYLNYNLEESNTTEHGWFLSERQESDDRSIAIARYPTYKGIAKTLFGKEQIQLEEFQRDTPTSPVKFHDLLTVSVTDQGCNLTATRKIPVVIKIPTPSEEKVEGARLIHHIGVTDTFNGSEVSRAQMTLYADNTKLDQTSNKDVAARCGESYWVNRWNWPSFDDTIETGTSNLDDISHLEVKIKQADDASWEMDYHLHRFYIIGKNWVYFDGNKRKFTAGRGNKHIGCVAIGKDCPDKPNSDNSRDNFNWGTGGSEPKGKWYLKDDPHSGTSTWEGNETIRIGADTNMDECS